MTRTCSTPIDLGPTAEYRNGLLDQRRRLELGYDEKRQQDPAPKSARRWLPARPKTSDSGCGTRRKSLKSRKEAVPQLSQQEVEEFETLPLAVRRKVSSSPACCLYYFFVLLYCICVPGTSSPLGGFLFASHACACRLHDGMCSAASVHGRGERTFKRSNDSLISSPQRRG
jgi:hypothetical protein